jgi:hypothetical protein
MHIVPAIGVMLASNLKPVHLAELWRKARHRNIRYEKRTSKPDGTVSASRGGSELTGQEPAPVFARQPNGNSTHKISLDQAARHFLKFLAERLRPSANRTRHRAVAHRLLAYPCW